VRTHLTDAEIAALVDGRSLHDVEGHVRLCVNCALRLGEVAQQSFVWERRGLFGRLVRVEPAEIVERLLDDVARDAA
jgi:hypothetical protein